MAYSWFLDTAETYSLLILVRLFCSMLLMACSVFQVDLVSIEIFYQSVRFIKSITFQEMKHLSSNIVLVLMVVTVSIADLFLYCFFGKVATDSHLEIADCLFEIDWLDMPIELQKHFILMIAHIQKPRYYHGFGVANLDLETFKKVKTSITPEIRKNSIYFRFFLQYLRIVYTFYMMFKTITHN